MTYPITIPSFEGKKGVLIIHFIHGADDAGDRGSYYSLIDQEGNLIQNGFSLFDHDVVIRQVVAAEQTYTFTITDHDTEFIGKHPGNLGNIEIQLDIEQHKYKP